MTRSRAPGCCGSTPPTPRRAGSWSGCGARGTTSAAGIERRTQAVGQRHRAARGVVVADHYAVALGEQAPVALDDHLEVDPERRAGHVPVAQPRPDLLLVEAGRAVVDV